MINPESVTNFDRTEAELEEFLLFCIVVAGKNSKVQAKKLDKFLAYGQRFSSTGSPLLSPFTILEITYKNFDLLRNLNWAKLGQYKRLYKCFENVMLLKDNLKTCTLEDLVSVFGIGMKTAKMFLLHSRRGKRHAVLDTHILKYLKAMGVENVPKNTPSSVKNYTRLENEFLAICDKNFKSPADMDLTVWVDTVKKS